MNENKNRHTVWLTDEAWTQVGSHYKADNCSTMNEYIEKAIRFYSGYLDAEHADSYLPRILSDVLDGELGTLGDRMGRLLFKMAVEEGMMMNVVAAAIEVSPDNLDKLRVRCVQEAKKINGTIKFEDAVVHQRGVE